MTRPVRVPVPARARAHDSTDMSLRTCPGPRPRRAAALNTGLALGLAGLMLATCTPTGVGGLPARPLKETQAAAFAVPMSLTASDGTGLKLVSLKARAVVEEPLAFTELHLVFENPTDRTIEGRFEINMPPNAAISRFAMQIFGAVAGGRGRRAPRRPGRLRGLPAPQAGPRAAREQGRQLLQRPRLPDPPARAQGADRLLLAGAPSSAEPYRLPLAASPSSTTSTPASSSARAHRRPRRRHHLDRHHHRQPPRHRAQASSSGPPTRTSRSSTSAASAMMGLRHDNLAVARVAVVRRHAPRADRRPHRPVRHQRLAGPRLRPPDRPTS
jgi:hypothetical protein